MDNPIVELTSQCYALEQYLKVKVLAHDWHAVSDAAIDLQVLEGQIKVLREKKARDEALREAHRKG